MLGALTTEKGFDQILIILAVVLNNLESVKSNNSDVW